MGPRRVPGPGEPEKHSARGVSDPETRLEGAADDVRSLGLNVPEDGRILWMTEDGTIRELHSTMVLSEMDAGSCDRCGSTQTFHTIAREHHACGHVRFDAFIAHESSSQYRCPKCDLETDDGSPFTEIGTLHSCARCGHPVDRALGVSSQE